MSTVAEHLAALEFFLEMRYAKDSTVRTFSGFGQEADLFCEVHLRELVAERDPAEMVAAREDMERRMREYHPQHAERLLAIWADARKLAAAQQGEKP